MLFNSYQFVLIFFPLTLVVFELLGRESRSARPFSWLILSSLVFYAWWNPVNVLLIGPSILVNYFLARALLRLRENRPRVARALLILGICGNVAFLSYFKYRNFVFGALNDVLGTHFVLEQLILPLGISFITFQKIAFLVDVYSGRVKSFTFHSYSLFVMFFPQLIAGPIVHYREMMPQFENATGRVGAEDLAVGIGLFFFGLFKKVILADGIAPYASPVYAAAANGEPVTLLYAWIAALGFTLQIYFDFSGYSDMALGLARCFGIRLPMNFNSPLRATSIIDFWGRWHITLTRFLTAYIYNPIALAQTRRRLAKGQPVLSARSVNTGAFVAVLMLPTLVTMFISGVWHGAGYQFIFWGLLHGCYLVVNHAWRLLRSGFWPDSRSYNRVMMPVGFMLTFGAVVFAMVFFRSSSIETGFVLVKGMIGLNGVSLPAAIGNRLGEWLPGAVTLEWSSGKNLVFSLIWIASLLGIAWVAPNTLQIFARYRPALGFGAVVEPPSVAVGGDGRRTPIAGAQLNWHPSIRWALAIALLAVGGILALGRPSEFLYWQF